MKRLAGLAAPFVMVSVIAMPAHAADPGSARVDNLELASGGAIILDSGLVAFGVREGMQGGTDLNGDGDADDNVLHVYDPFRRATTNTGLDHVAMVGVGNLIALAVSESLAGKDLNGDGDISFLDRVVHVFDPATGALTNTGFAHGSLIVAVGTAIGFTVSESAQGSTDLNGDGDTDDAVAFGYDPATRRSVNSGLATRFGNMSAARDYAVFGVAEADQGHTDLNGDGDTSDSVIHVLDPMTGATLSSGVTHGFFGFAIGGNRVGIAVSENRQGNTDLNGDGDAIDDVVHVLDPASGTTVNTGIDGGGSAPLLAVGERFVASVIEEADLNGDGDTDDAVFQVFDPETGTTHNTGVAHRFAAAAAGDLVAITVSEENQGGTDLNRDGDTDDLILHVFNPSDDSIVNTRLMGDFGSLGDRIALLLNETLTGTDLNRDGDVDLADFVLHVYDPATNTVVNSELAIDFLGIQTAGRRAVFAVSEFAQGGSDLNGDGGFGDPVAAAYDPVTDTWFNLGVAADLAPTVARDVVAIRVPEIFQGGSDLNADGDTDDEVLHVAMLPRPDGVGVVDPATGRWFLRGSTIEFTYGNPGDLPFLGDWDCDGIETPGLYRQADGFVYLRNSNTTGIANVSYFFGDPEDVPLAGDFDGDGCDTVSLYRPSEATVYVHNELGSDGGALGAAQFSYPFGAPGDTPLVGDFDGDGQDTVGVHRPATGELHLRNSLDAGAADATFIYGNPGDTPLAGDWNGTGFDTPGAFRPTEAAFYLRHSTSQGRADQSFLLGDPGWSPVHGDFLRGG